MVPGDLVFVRPDEPALPDYLVAADVEPVDAVRCRQDEAGDRIGGAGELEPVGAPHGDVGPLARLERADVVTPEHGGAAPRAQPQRVPDGQGRRAAAPACDEQRLLDLEQQVAALVRRRAVDPEPNANARVEEVADRRDAGTETEVRRRTVCDSGTRVREAADVGSRQVDAVRAPDVAVEPAERAQVLDRRAAVEVAAVRLLLDR